jgi:DNA-binding protein HU-beta
MNKLIELLANDTRRPAHEVRRDLKALATAIHYLLATDGEVAIPGVGRLKVGKWSRRIGTNISTGDPMMMPERKTVKITASKRTKDAIN